MNQAKPLSTTELLGRVVGCLGGLAILGLGVNAFYDGVSTGAARSGSLGNAAAVWVGAAVGIAVMVLGVLQMFCTVTMRESAPVRGSVGLVLTALSTFVILLIWLRVPQTRFPNPEAQQLAYWVLLAILGLLVAATVSVTRALMAWYGGGREGERRGELSARPGAKGRRWLMILALVMAGLRLASVVLAITNAVQVSSLVHDDRFLRTQLFLMLPSWLLSVGVAVGYALCGWRCARPGWTPVVTLAALSVFSAANYIAGTLQIAQTHYWGGSMSWLIDGRRTPLVSAAIRSLVYWGELVGTVSLLGISLWQIFRSSEGEPEGRGGRLGGQVLAIAGGAAWTAGAAYLLLLAVTLWAMGPPDPGVQGNLSGNYLLGAAACGLTAALFFLGMRRLDSGNGGAALVLVAGTLHTAACVWGVAWLHGQLNDPARANGSTFLRTLLEMGSVWNRVGLSAVLGGILLLGIMIRLLMTQAPADVATAGGGERDRN